MSSHVNSHQVTSSFHPSSIFFFLSPSGGIFFALFVLFSSLKIKGIAFWLQNAHPLYLLHRIANAIFTFASQRKTNRLHFSKMTSRRVANCREEFADFDFAEIREAFTARNEKNGRGYGVDWVCAITTLHLSSAQWLFTNNFGSFSIRPQPHSSEINANYN